MTKRQKLAICALVVLATLESVVIFGGLWATKIYAQVPHPTTYQIELYNGQGENGGAEVVDPSFAKLVDGRACVQYTYNDGTNLQITYCGSFKLTVKGHLFRQGED